MMSISFKLSNSVRICSNCNSTITRITKNGAEHWYNYNSGKICHRCYYKLIGSPRYYKDNSEKIKSYHREYYYQHLDKMRENIKKRNVIYHVRRLRYKDKQILLKENPRIGICSVCHRRVGDEIKQTQMHHIQYHDDDPLKDTIELCVKCHKEQHRCIEKNQSPF